MNIRNLQLAIVVCIALSLTACGNNSEEKTTELESSSVDTVVEDVDNKPEEELSESTEEVITSTKANNDIDAYIKSYEEYVDQYLKLIKKSKSGDLSAMTEYTEYLQKTSDVSEKIQNIKSEMSPAQMDKFLKIHTKLIKAAAN